MEKPRLPLPPAEVLAELKRQAIEYALEQARLAGYKEGENQAQQKALTGGGIVSTQGIKNGTTGLPTVEAGVHRHELNRDQVLAIIGGLSSNTKTATAAEGGAVVIGDRLDEEGRVNLILQDETTKSVSEIVVPNGVDESRLKFAFGGQPVIEGDSAQAVQIMGVSIPGGPSFNIFDGFKIGENHNKLGERKIEEIDDDETRQRVLDQFMESVQQTIHATIQSQMRDSEVPLTILPATTMTRAEHQEAEAQLRKKEVGGSGTIPQQPVSYQSNFGSCNEPVETADFDDLAQVDDDMFVMRYANSGMGGINKKFLPSPSKATRPVASSPPKRKGGIAGWLRCGGIEGGGADKMTQPYFCATQRRGEPMSSNIIKHDDDRREVTLRRSDHMKKSHSRSAQRGGRGEPNMPLASALASRGQPTIESIVGARAASPEEQRRPHTSRVHPGYRRDSRKTEDVPAVGQADLFNDRMPNMARSPPPRDKSERRTQEKRDHPRLRPEADLKTVEQFYQDSLKHGLVVSKPNSSNVSMSPVSPTSSAARDASPVRMNFLLSGAAATDRMSVHTTIAQPSPASLRILSLGSKPDFRFPVSSGMSPSPTVASSGMSPTITSSGVSPTITSSGMSPTMTSTGMSPTVATSATAPSPTVMSGSRSPHTTTTTTTPFAPSNVSAAPAAAATVMSTSGQRARSPPSSIISSNLNERRSVPISSVPVFPSVPVVSSSQQPPTLSYSVASQLSGSQALTHSAGPPFGNSGVPLPPLYMLPHPNSPGPLMSPTYNMSRHPLTAFPSRAMPVTTSTTTTMLDVTPVVGIPLAQIQKGGGLISYGSSPMMTTAFTHIPTASNATTTVLRSTITGPTGAAVPYISHPAAITGIMNPGLSSVVSLGSGEAGSGGGGGGVSIPAILSTSTEKHKHKKSKRSKKSTNRKKKTETGDAPADQQPAPAETSVPLVVSAPVSSQTTTPIDAGGEESIVDASKLKETNVDTASAGVSPTETETAVIVDNDPTPSSVAVVVCPADEEIITEIASPPDQNSETTKAISVGVDNLDQQKLTAVESGTDQMGSLTAGSARVKEEVPRQASMKSLVKSEASSSNTVKFAETETPFPQPEFTKSVDVLGLSGQQQSVAIYRVLSVPDIQWLQNFLSTEEVQKLLDLAQDDWESIPNKFKLSLFGENKSHEIFDLIRQRAANLLGVKLECVEPPACISYDSTSRVGPHISGSKQAYSILVYLNDCGDEFRTNFPYLNFSIPTKTGSAVLISHMDTNGENHKFGEWVEVPPNSDLEKIVMVLSVLTETSD